MSSTAPSGYRPVRLGPVDLGPRPPELQLEHGVRIPLDPAIVTPLAQFSLDADFAEDIARRAGLAARAEGAGVPCTFSVSVAVLRVSYPAMFHVAATCLGYEVRVLDMQLGSAGWGSDYVMALEDLALECYQSGSEPEYYDDEFRQLVKTVGARDEAEFKARLQSDDPMLC